MENKIPKEEVEFFLKHAETLKEMYAGLTEEILELNGIQSISIIAEGTMTPMMLIKYTNGSSDSFKGYIDMENTLNKIK